MTKDHKLADAIANIKLGDLPAEIKGLQALGQGDTTNLASDMADVAGLNPKTNVAKGR